MKRKLMIILLFALVYSGFLFYQGCTNSSNTLTNGNRTFTQTECPKPTTLFPSYHEIYAPPDWWCQENKTNEKEFPIFQLSQDYPESYSEYIKSDCPEKECPWKQFSFKTNQMKYLKAIIDYAFEGNLEVDWVVQANPKKRKWFHAPNMHFDIVNPLDPTQIEVKVAREFIHGLTMERVSCLSELNYKVGNKSCEQRFDFWDKEKSFSSWAISVYNERGASYIAKVWNEIVNPASRLPDPEKFKEGFPDGTVAVKLLFTQAPAKDVQNPNREVRYLDKSVEWNADIADYIRENNNTRRAREKRVTQEDCNKDWEKCFPKVRLLQIDIAVKHKRDVNAPTGWVFATFMYDKDAPPFIDYTFPSTLSNEEIEKKKAWLRIKPIGLMFGNDPTIMKGGHINESWLNTELKIPQHYGCGDNLNPLKRRLNGPVDSPASSCISCHAQSETPKDLNIGDVPYIDMKCDSEQDIVEWFKNINPLNPDQPTHTPSTDEKPMFSLDYSLQLREGIRRYCVANQDKCNVTFEKGKKYTVITKQGTKTYTIQ